MAVYKLGSSGDEVRRIQVRLKDMGLYRGPVDGIFGGGTYSAIKTFQRDKGLLVDGIIGPDTWRLLFDDEISGPAAFQGTSDYKCLALTGSFETGKGIPECFAGLSGDFDGQGMSFGVLQWNFGQNSLQPLLKKMIGEYPDTVRSIFHTNYDVLLEALNTDKDELMEFVRSLQHPVRHYFYEPWKGMFKALGRTQEFQNIQVRHAEKLFDSAKDLCSEFGLWSERAVALMFDIRVQNGGIQRLVRSQIRAEIDGLRGDMTKEEREIEKMRIVANRRAEASNARWIEDVRIRKLCIANGKGTVHGIYYDIADQYGISLKQPVV